MPPIRTSPAAFPTEYQRRHASLMEMDRLQAGFTGHPRGRVALALLTASHYRRMATAHSATAGDRRFWLRLAFSAATRAREDRTKSQPAQARFHAAIVSVADDCVAMTDALRAPPAPQFLSREMEKIDG